MDTVHTKQILPVIFSHALFFLLDFLTFEIGANKLSENTGKELILYAL